MSVEQLGAALTGTYAVGGGEARVYERGATITGAGGEAIVRFAFPMLGIPQIAVGDAATASVFEGHALTFQPPFAWPVDALVSVLHTALAGRLALLPTAQPPQPTPLVFSAANIVVPPGANIPPTYGIATSAALQERQLYDVVVLTDAGQWHVIAPHALYYRSAWNDFGIAHITDIHVARRIDFFRGRLQELGRTDAAQKMTNWNDRFRGFIRYANYLHGLGMLDLILATGDIVDYLFEDDDDEHGGNALFARQMILGQAPGPQFPDVEELRVPIFMVPGNHDYRKHPYKLLFNIDPGGWWVGEKLADIVGDRQVKNYYGYHLLWRDGLALSRGDNGHDVPERSAESAAKMVEVDAENRPYATYLADRRAYVIRLGAHRIAMLDSAYDLGMVTSKMDGLRNVLGLASEDEKTFAGGAPNSEGVTEREARLVSTALDETPDGGLFILGTHAPLFNLWNSAYPYFLRETQRPALPQQVRSFLARLDGSHSSWLPPDGTKGEPAYVKRGDTDDALDYGVSRGKAEEVIRLLAGIGARRPADLVLQGHTHRYNEFRIANVDGELAFFMDFYTQNPAHYYPTRFTQGQDADDTDVAYVDIIDGTPARAAPSAMPYDAMHKYIVTVPPYPTPLASAPDPRGWWAAHRPLVLQTGALGPLENSQVSFSGFRLVSVKGDVIDKIHHVSIEKLESNNYRLPWDEAIRPEPPRRHRHAQRSQEHGAPTAAGSPVGYVFPSTGTHHIVYRDTAGHLIELWQDAAGTSGYGDLTGAAGATPAAGDPYVYLDSAASMHIVVYRGTDDHVHSLYWSAGAVGHDNLSGSIEAPPAVGKPTGYLNTATNTHHVIYRSDDGHLHTLWWVGQNGVGHDAATASAKAPPAAGDPAAYFDPVHNDNIVVYRGTDDHIHSLYWSTDAIGHDNLSGAAGAPQAASDPVAYKTVFNDAHQVTYRSDDGHLHELWWVGVEPVNHWDLTAAAQAPPAVDHPAAYYSARTNTKHVMYRSADGHLNELWWTPGGGTPAHVDLSLAAVAPPAAAQPAGWEGPTDQHVAYRGTDRQIHEIHWS